MGLPYRRVVVTGGAGFVGCHLALALRQAMAQGVVIALDNLRRRGSELSLDRLRDGGVLFRHGDVRSPDDIDMLGPVDLLIECSAEPSVHAGYASSPGYLVSTNLNGLVHSLDHLRRHGGDLVFLSTSRVYPIGALRTLPLVPHDDRLDLSPRAKGQGWSRMGIAEAFPLAGSRSLYGATKLAAELLIEEYRAMYGLRAIVNRFGVIAGPWQMGRVDQGFVAHWVARHLSGGHLSYSGFGGAGLQVRDVLHIDDVCRLCVRQIATMSDHDGAVYNVGGGAAGSVSLRELTQICVEETGRRIAIDADPSTRPADIPYFVSDSRLVQDRTGWRPQLRIRETVADVHRWLLDSGLRLDALTTV